MSIETSVHNVTNVTAKPATLLNTCETWTRDIVITHSNGEILTITMFSATKDGVTRILS